MEAITQIPQFYPTEFGTNWNHLVQQMESRLRGFVQIETVVGKEKTINQIGTQTMSKVLNRAGRTKVSDVALDKRWIRPFPYELGNVFDQWDETFLGQIVLPTSDVMKSHVFAYDRACDQVIIDALGGTSYSGETGVTANTLSTSQTVAKDYVASGGATTSGLTLAKLDRF